MKTKVTLYFGRTWQSWIVYLGSAVLAAHILEVNWRLAHQHSFITLFVNVIVFSYVVDETFKFRDLKKVVDVDA